MNTHQLFETIATVGRDRVFIKVRARDETEARSKVDEIVERLDSNLRRGVISGAHLPDCSSQWLRKSETEDEFFARMGDFI